MARHRRSLEDLLADAAGQNRANAGLSYSTPAMAPVSADHLDEPLRENIETVTRDVSTLANTLSELELSQGNNTSDLVALDEALTRLDGQLTELDGQLAANSDQIAADKAQLAIDMERLDGELGTIDTRIETAISDSLAVPITSDRFTENSLSIWPFIQGAVPIGALAPGAVGSNELADFSLVVRKFKDDRHRLY